MTRILQAAIAGAFLATATGCAFQHDFSMPGTSAGGSGSYGSAYGSSYGGYYGSGAAPWFYYGNGSGYYGSGYYGSGYFGLGHYSPFDYYYRQDPFYRGGFSPYPLYGYGYYPYPYARYCWDRNGDGRCDRRKHDRGDDGKDRDRNVRDRDRDRDGPPSERRVYQPRPDLEPTRRVDRDEAGLAPAIDAVKRPTPRIPAVEIPRSQPPAVRPEVRVARPEVRPTPPPQPRVSAPPAPERSGGFQRAGRMESGGDSPTPARRGGGDNPRMQTP